MEKEIKKKNSKQFNKKFRKQFFTLKSGIVIVLTVVIILFLAAGGLYQKKQADSYRQAIKELKSEIKDIDETNKQLEKEREETNTKEFKERVAREKLGLIGKGEYLVKESEGKVSPDDKKEKEPTDNKNNQEEN